MLSNNATNACVLSVACCIGIMCNRFHHTLILFVFLLNPLFLSLLISIYRHISVSVCVCDSLFLCDSARLSIIPSFSLPPSRPTGKKKVTVDVFMRVADLQGLFSRSLRLSTLPLLEQHTPMPPASEQGTYSYLLYVLVLTCFNFSTYFYVSTCLYLHT